MAHGQQVKQLQKAKHSSVDKSSEMSTLALTECCNIQPAISAIGRLPPQAIGHRGHKT